MSRIGNLMIIDITDETKTILLTTVATGTLMCEPVMAYAVDSTPDSMGWFRKKKKE